MTIERITDKNYPFTIKDSWGHKIYCDLADLKEIRKEINKILKEEKVLKK